MNLKVYEVIIGSGTFYTQAFDIRSALINSEKYADSLDYTDKTIKSIMCVAVIDY